MHKCKYFKIQELVSRAVYLQFGEFAWSFFDPEYLKELDLIRETWGAAIIINNWAAGGQYNESGLRSNVDSLVKGKTKPYLSGHVLAKGCDLKPADMKRFKELYNHIWKLMNSGKLKYFKRLENFKSTPTWVHIDGLQTSNGKPQIFNI